jgi:superfamily II DNA or RNA helicase
MTPAKTRPEDTGNQETDRSQEDVIRSLEVSLALGQAAHGASSVRVGNLEIQAREYQSEVWGAIQSAREAGEDGALVHLATGLGKTTVGVADALRFADGFIEKEGRTPNILFAVHQTEILDQAAERFAAVESDLTQGRYDGKTKNLSSTVTFATLQSLYKNLEGLDPEQFDYIIYDEVHHAQADTFKKVVEYFKPKFRLGLTATPDRMDDKDIRELFGTEIYSKPLAEAMTEGYLADVDYHIVFDEAVKKAMESGFNPTTMKEVQDLLENESRNEEIALQIHDKMEEIGLEDAKTIIFCQNIQQADQMAQLLGGRSYHSGLKKGERIDTLEAFKKNGLQVITTRDMFNEGVDIPDARLIIFLRSTSSKTVFEQQLGRGLRKNAGKDTVSVLDFVANIERLTYVKELVDEIKRVRDEQAEREVSLLQGGEERQCRERLLAFYNTRRFRLR